jgi:hypothetical protein
LGEFIEALDDLVSEGLGLGTLAQHPISLAQHQTSGRF